MHLDDIHDQPRQLFTLGPSDIMQVLDLAVYLDPRVRLFRRERKLGQKGSFGAWDEMGTAMFEGFSDHVVRFEHEDPLQA